MNNTDVKINITKFSKYIDMSKKGIGRDDDTVNDILEAFAGYVKRFYMRVIEEAMNSQRYKGTWEPVNDKGYQEYLGIKPEGDILAYIVDALTVVRAGYNFVIRIDPRYRYPGTRLPLARVIRSIDNGTARFKSRPIFSKIVRDVTSHLLDLWRGYLSMKGLIGGA